MEDDGKRSKRTTRFTGDYQKLYKDLDIGSSDDEAGSDDDAYGRKKKTPKGGRGSSGGRSRTKECPGCGSRVSTAVKQCTSCDYQFSSKSMLMMTGSSQTMEEESASIREKFPFEPERDEDGSLLIQNILQRKLRHMRNRWSRQSGLSATELSEMSAAEAKYEYEYLVKFKGLSYLHVQWLTATDIEAMNKKSKQVLQRYLTKLDASKVDGEFPAEMEFDPSNLEVEKILDMREEEVTEVVDAGIDGKDDKPIKADTDDDRTEKSSIKSTMSFNSIPDVETKDASVLERKPSKSAAEVESTETSDSKTKILNHPERCKKILERLMEDPYSTSFIDPVDIETYEDYLDIIEEPMCLKDVQEKLESGGYNKYQQYKQFAKDVRLIWDNCKNYNLYKSQIWHTAHVMSLLFERLYQAWLLSYIDMPVPMDDPVAQPWCTGCRVCLNDSNDDKMMLCDHCDAAYHIYCLRPQLPKVPEGSWICKRCTTWLQSQPTANSLSATNEDEARNIAENANAKKVVRIKKKKYLVKWRGLSYKDCTWESVKDINDDEKIAEYHVLNDAPPDEPPLTQAEIGVEIAKDRRTQTMPPIRYPNAIQDLDAEIYAQIRTLHFLRWNRIPPSALLNECGSAGPALNHNSRKAFLVPMPMKTILDGMRQGGHFSAIGSIASSAAVSTGVDSTESDKSSAMEIVEAKEDDETTSTTHANGTGAVSMDAAENGLAREREDEEIEKDDASKLQQQKKKLDISLEEAKMEAWTEPKRVATSVIEEELADVLGCMVHSVSRCLRMDPYPARAKLPYPSVPASEIEVCVAKGKQPLCMKVGNVRKRHFVMGFRLTDQGKKGPAEMCGRIKVGDILVAVNNQSLLDCTPAEVSKILANAQSPFVYLRLLRCSSTAYFERMRIAKENAAELAAETGNTFQYVPPFDVVEDYYNRVKDPVPTRRPHPLRSLYFGVYPVYVTEDGKIGGHKMKWSVELFKDYQCIKGGVFDNEKEAAMAYDDLAEEHEENYRYNFVEDSNGEKLTPFAQLIFDEVTEEREANAALLEELRGAVNDEDSKRTTDDDDKVQEEVTAESVMLDGYHSMDSRDSDSLIASSEEESDSDDEGSDVDAWDSDDDSEVEYKPTKVKQHVEEGNGQVSRLLRAVNETEFPPNRSDWTNYILEMGTEKWANGFNSSSALKSGSRIDQLDPVSGVIIDTWDTINIASRQLGIAPAAISACLMGKTDEAGGFKWRISSQSSSAIDDEDSLPGADEKKEEAWKSKLHTKTKEYRSGGTLRDYQLNGLNWLLRCWYSKRSSILADEMGLGKTVQVVSFLDHLYEVENIRGPFLVCVPLSTIEHWKRESEGWSRMGVCLYHDVGGGRDMRDVIREFEWYYSNRSRRLLKFHLLITTFDDLIKDYEELAEVPWRVVVVDEAHRLRNVNSKLIECMRSVVAKGLSAFGYQHRILMTGTPLQNNTAELFSLLNFIEPAKFPDAEKFNQRFGVIQTQEQVEALQRRIAPHLLRRVKEDVAKDIPPKEETIIDVELTTMQKQFYRAIFERNIGFLTQSLKAGSMPKLMNIQMELRKCCNHPFLIQGVEDTEMERLDQVVQEQLLNSSSKSKKFDKKAFIAKRMDDFLIPQSGKMVLLDKLLPKLRKEEHKVLIFSQMVKMIDYIEEFCEFRGYPVERLDGRVGGNDRQKAIDRFNRDANSFVFLLSTRAGGVGINLTAADTVIIFDSDWNPQNDVQAMARCHRIGQSKRVTIYRLITRRSFESEMFERASKKLGLEQAVLGSRQFNDQDMEESQKSNAKMDAKEMEQLLREGAYAVLLEQDEDESKAFYNQDIDSILEQRAHVLVSDTAGGGTTESWLNKMPLKKIRARKSMFTGDNAMEHAEIDVNDPDFWKKVLPDLVTPDMMLERLTDQSLLDANGDPDPDAIEKYMKDLGQMMEGMLDLNRRGNLPDRERAICMKLLLRMVVKEDLFEDEERAQAQEWYTMVEGSRKRTSRQDQRTGTDVAAGAGATPGGPKKRGRPPLPGKESSGKKSSGARGRRSNDSDLDNGSDDDDLDSELSDVDAELGVAGNKSKRGRPKGSLNKLPSKKSAAAGKQPAKRKRNQSDDEYDEYMGGGGAGDDSDLMDDSPPVVSASKKKKKKVAIALDDDDEAMDFVAEKKAPKPKVKATPKPKASSSTSANSSSKKKSAGTGSSSKSGSKYSLQNYLRRDDDDDEMFGSDDDDLYRSASTATPTTSGSSSRPLSSKPKASGGGKQASASTKKGKGKDSAAVTPAPAASATPATTASNVSRSSSGRVTKKLSFVDDYVDADDDDDEDDGFDDGDSDEEYEDVVDVVNAGQIGSPESRRLRESFLSSAGAGTSANNNGRGGGGHGDDDTVPMDEEEVL